MSTDCRKHRLPTNQRCNQVKNGVELPILFTSGTLFFPLHNPSMNFINARFAPVFFRSPRPNRLSQDKKYRALPSIAEATCSASRARIRQRPSINLPSFKTSSDCTTCSAHNSTTFSILARLSSLKTCATSKARMSELMLIAQARCYPGIKTLRPE
jgi:hypothetical protein